MQEGIAVEGTHPRVNLKGFVTLGKSFHLFSLQFAFCNMVLKMHLPLSLRSSINT